MRIWCCACQADVDARLTSGVEVYPHRVDLGALPLWKCDACGNHVGTHHKTDQPTRPLGVIPSPEVRRARMLIHDLIDPVWRSGKVRRQALYTAIGKKIGRKYHTADVRSIEDAREAYRAAQDVLRDLRVRNG